MVLRALARDSVIYGGADLVSKLIAFVAFPLIAAALSPRAFGTLDLLLTGTALLGMIANCGLNNAIQRYYWDSATPASNRPLLVSTALFTLGGFVMLAAAVGAITLAAMPETLIPSDLGLGSWGLAASLALMAGTQLVQFLLDVTRLQMAPWRFVLVALCSRVLTALAGVAAVVWMGWGLDGLIGAQALVMAAAIPLGMVAVRADLVRRYDGPLARSLVQFGHPFIYAGLAFWLFGSMDRWLLASIASVEEVGIYSVAHRFATVVLFVSTAFGQAWSPMAIKIRSDHPDDYRALYAEVLVALTSLMMVLSAAVALFAPELIGWLMPPAYRAASWSLAALVLGLVWQASMQVTAVGISIQGKTHLFARLSWIAAALNLALNIAMIPTIGALGSAVATVLAYLFLTGAYLYHTQRLHPLPLPWKRLGLLCMTWCAVVTWVAAASQGMAWANNITGRLTLLLICVATCILSIHWRAAIELKR